MGEKLGELGSQSAGRLFDGRAVHQKICHFFKVCAGFCVGAFSIGKFDVGYQHYPSAVVIKGDDLIKQHKIGIFEMLAVIDRNLYAWLAVAYEIVGEVADKSACERRQTLYLRAAVVRKQLADMLCGVVCRYLLIADGEGGIIAGEAKCGIIAHK